MLVAEVGEIETSRRLKILVSIQVYNGVEKIDIRAYFKDENEAWIPTGKGVRIKFEQTDALLRLLKKAQKLQTNKTR